MPTSQRQKIEKWLDEEEFAHLPDIVKMGPRAEKILEEIAADGKDKTARHRALIALGQIGGDSGKNAVASALRSRDPVMRVLALQAIQGNPADLGAEPSIVKGALRSLSVVDESTRLHAARAVAAVADQPNARTVAGALEKVIQEDESVVVREAAATALSRLPLKPVDPE